jgi:7-cyano-7-deazaguanine synthase
MMAQGVKVALEKHPTCRLPMPESPQNSRLAVVLLSGGLDSATTAAIARAEGFRLAALSVDYGQRHRFELVAARRVAEALGVAEHQIASVDLRGFGGSALTDELDVPQDRTAEDMSSGIPITYVPARNTVMLSLALALAEARGAADLFLGVNAVDYSGYPDCRPEFVAAFEQLANLATKAGVEGASHFRVHAPLITMTKAEIIRRGVELGVDYSLTHSCYAPDETGAACGRCDSCLLRLKGFAEAGLVDPARYRISDSPQRTQRAQREPGDNANQVSGEVVDAAIAVHRRLGPGLLESAYESCLAFELRRRGLKVSQQVDLPLLYDGHLVGVGYRLDLVVEDVVVVEIKSVENLAPIHEAQMLSYLKLSGKPIGLLINFNVDLLKHGLKRLAN